MRKPVLVFAAVVLFLFYNYGMYRWLLSNHGFNDVWQAATSDWLLTITLVDMGVFSLLCLIWLYRDMTKRSFGTAKKFFLFFCALIMGAVVLLLYLAFRKGEHSEQS